MKLVYDVGDSASVRISLRGYQMEHYHCDIECRNQKEAIYAIMDLHNSGKTCGVINGMIISIDHCNQLITVRQLKSNLRKSK